MFFEQLFQCVGFFPEVLIVFCVGILHELPVEKPGAGGQQKKRRARIPCRKPECQTARLFTLPEHIPLRELYGSTSYQTDHLPWTVAAVRVRRLRSYRSRNSCPRLVQRSGCAKGPLRHGGQTEPAEETPWESGRAVSRHELPCGSTDRARYRPGAWFHRAVPGRGEVLSACGPTVQRRQTA